MATGSLVLALLSWLTIASSADACSLPVFRYALERWAPASFELSVYHNAPLTPEDQAILDQVNAKRLANLSVWEVDMQDKTSDEDRAAWLSRPQDAGDGPWAVIRYGERDYGGELWSGPLAKLPVDIARSPARQRIAELLAAGESAVWVLVETGDKAADDAAYAILSQSLTHWQSVLILPEQPPADEADAASVMWALAPLKISFAIVRVSAADPAEQMLLTMLRQSDWVHGVEAEPTDASTKVTPTPAAYAIFGRGRAMWGLSGNDLDRDTIGELAQFLVEPCSCQARDLNPGLDLLIAFDWEEKLFSQDVSVPASAEAVAPAAAEPPQWVASASLPTPSAAPVAAVPSPPVGDDRSWMRYGLGASLLLMTLAAGLWMSSHRRAATRAVAGKGS